MEDTLSRERRALRKKVRDNSKNNVGVSKVTKLSSFGKEEYP
jgi:hypothetical protein